MSDKEKLLAIVVVGAVLMLAGLFTTVKVMDAFDTRKDAIAELESEVQQRETVKNKGLAAKKMLTGEYSQRSLPSDAERAELLDRLVEVSPG